MPSPLLTALAPATLTILGIGATVVALQDEEASVTTAVVWVDAPFADAHLEPGDIAVLAHASTTAPVEAMELVVDGDVVAVDDDLLADGEIVVAQLVWAAEDGIHELVVRTDEGLASAPRTVTVGGVDVPLSDGSTTTVADEATTTTATTAPGDTTTSSATTTSSPQPTGTQPTGPPDTVSPPPTQATTSTTRPPAPTVGFGEVFQVGPYPGFVCGQTGAARGYADVRVTITGNVTIAQIRLYNAAMGTITLPDAMVRSGTTYTARVYWAEPMRDGDTALSVLATGPGGSDESQIDGVTLRYNCPKD